MLKTTCVGCKRWKELGWKPMRDNITSRTSTQKNWALGLLFDWPTHGTSCGHRLHLIKIPNLDNHLFNKRNKENKRKLKGLAKPLAQAEKPFR